MVRSRESIEDERSGLCSSEFQSSEFNRGRWASSAQGPPTPHAALPVLTKVPTASPPACAWQVVFEFKRVCRKAADAGLQGTSALHSRTLPALWE